MIRFLVLCILVINTPVIGSIAYPHMIVHTLCSLWSIPGRRHFTSAHIRCNHINVRIRPGTPLTPGSRVVNTFKWISCRFRTRNANRVIHNPVANPLDRDSCTPFFLKQHTCNVRFILFKNNGSKQA